MIVPPGCRYTKGGTLLALAAAIAACGDSTQASPSCSAQFPLSVSTANPVPTFTWTSACPIWHLSVTYVDSNYTVLPAWDVYGPSDSNTVQPPVAYGTLPMHAMELSTAVPLVHGRIYKVMVIHYDSGQHVLDGGGMASFTFP